MKAILLKINLDGEIRTVSRHAYVTAKHKQMVDFGYSTLTKSEVDTQVELVIAGKTMADGLSVIGMFMKDDLTPMIKT